MSNVEVIKHIFEDNGLSIMVYDLEEDLKLWVDVWAVDNELEMDWNMYIFDLRNDRDLSIKYYQEDCENYENVYSYVKDYVYEKNLNTLIGIKGE